MEILYYAKKVEKESNSFNGINVILKPKIKKVIQTIIIIPT